MNNSKTFLLLILSFFVTIGWGQIKLPKLISDGAILQRDTDLKLWGWASPNESISLHFNSTTYKAKADVNGNWDLTIPPQVAGGPHKMIFRGKNEIILKNILFGDVWLCSGQSNMELPMRRLKDAYPNEIKNANNTNIRQFLVPDEYDFNTSFSDVSSGSWKEINRENILETSGVAYFFAKDLYDTYKVPIGLINSALGGSPVEAWMSEDALKSFPKSYNELQKFKNTSYINSIEQDDKARQQTWYNELEEKDAGFIKDKEWFSENIDDTDWKEMKIPGFWADQELGAVNGVVWFRKQINIKKNMLGKEANLWLGRIVDQDHVYVNGEFVGTTGYQYPPRKYKINHSILKEGLNTIVVRVINEQGRGGFILDKPYFLNVENDTIDLKGIWNYKLGASMEPLQGPTFIRWKPGGLYNKMIAPLVNYKIKGAIWYQGESNTSDPDSYFKTFPAMINNWRDKWNQGNFPFIFVQLANFMEETDQPSESNWAKLRQAQLETLAVPNTGMAVITDIGEWNDIHPLNKKDVGKRLAQEAFKLAYGEKNTKLCPIPKNYEFGKKQVTIKFTNAENGLLTNDGEDLRYFEISNDGKTFVKASAMINDDKVIVWNETVKQPTVVRYGWANNPAKANLFSVEGLPASSFEIKK